MPAVYTFVLSIGITLQFVASQLTSTVGYSTDFSNCVVEGEPFTLTCTCVPDSTAVSQLRWFETDVSGDIIYNYNGAAGALQGDFATRAVATLDVTTTVVSTIVFDEYDSSQDVSQYVCRCVAGTDTLDPTVTLPTIYNPPSSLTVAITTCEADSVVATVTGNTNTGNACGEQIVFQVESTDATTCTDLSSTCTLATSEYSVGDTITVSVTQFDQTAQAPASCTPNEKSDEKKNGGGLEAWEIALICIGVILGVVIIAVIIIIIVCLCKKKGTAAGSRKYQKEENNESQEEENKKSDKDKEQPKDKDVEKNQKGPKKSKEITNKKSDKDIEQAKDKPVNKIQKGENMPKEEANKKPNKDIEQGKDKQAYENQKDQKDVSKEEKNKKSNKGIEQANAKQANENKKGEGDMSKEEMNKKSDKGIEQSKDEKAPQYEKLRGVHGMKKT